MPTMNISLPDAFRAFVEDQVAQRHSGTTSEYIRDLIRGDRNRQDLSNPRNLLLAGAASESGPVADRRYLDDLRDEVSAVTGESRSSEQSEA